MNRIVLIGNGFDRAHELNTSYEQFINWFWRKIIREYSTSKLIGDLDAIIKLPQKELSNSMHIQLRPFKESTCYSSFKKELAGRLGLSKIVFKNRFLELISEKVSLQNWVDIEEEYYAELKAIANLGIAELNIDIASLNGGFEEVKGGLEEYLESLIEPEFKRCIYDKIYSTIKPRDLSDPYVKGFIQDIIQNVNSVVSKDSQVFSASDYERFALEDYKHVLANQEISHDYIITKMEENNWQYLPSYTSPQNILLLNFNYTETGRLYLNDPKYYNKTRLIHIHGEIRKSENPIIFGYGDELCENYKTIENNRDKRMLKNIKSISYLQTDNYKKLLNFIESDVYQVFVMGHSCGLSDRTLLNTLFEHENCASIKVYYHKWKNEHGEFEDNYTDVIQNITRIFTKKVVMRERVVNKVYCEPLIDIK